MSRYCLNFTALSSFFYVKKQRPKTNLEKCYQSSVNIEISLDVKVCFSLVKYKINDLIALRSTSHITEISAPWWLFQEMWPNPKEIVDLVTFTEEILNGKLHFLCSGYFSLQTQNLCGSMFFIIKFLYFNRLQEVRTKSKSTWLIILPDKTFEMTLNSKHRTEKLKTKDTETRKIKSQKDESLVLPKE